MSLETIRAAIVAKIASVSGIGRVHDYERFAKDQKDFQLLYKDAASGRILGWHVRRVATAATSIALGRWQETHQWEVRGFMGIDDADGSEKLFDVAIEAIREAFRLDDSLGGAVATCTTREAAGMQLTSSGPVMFAGVLCHGCTLALSTVSAV